MIKFKDILNESIKLKLNKINKWYYTGIYNNVKFEIVAYNTDVKEPIWWGFGIDKYGSGRYSEAEDSFKTRTQAQEALKEYIDEYL
jgi:hypothetical protein